METCSVENCPKPSDARGWCSMHYRRWCRYGRLSLLTRVTEACSSCSTPAKAKGLCQFHYDRKRRPGRTPEERMFSKFLVGDDCWEWTGSKNASGYGNFRVPRGVVTTAHRAVYEWLVGPIPEGLQLDHLCFNRICVNPGHMEPVTLRENVRRQWAQAKATA